MYEPRGDLDHAHFGGTFWGVGIFHSLTCMVEESLTEGIVLCHTFDLINQELWMYHMFELVYEIWCQAIIVELYCMLKLL